MTLKELNQVMPEWVKWAISLLVFVAVTSLSANAWFLQRDREVLDAKLSNLQHLIENQNQQINILLEDNRKTNKQIEKLSILICLNYADRAKLIKEGFLKDDKGNPGPYPHGR